VLNCFRIKLTLGHSSESNSSCLKTLDLNYALIEENYLSDIIQNNNDTSIVNYLLYFVYHALKSYGDS